MTDLAPDLAKLRAAAQRRDADECQFLLKRLFQQLEFVVALGIAAEQAYAYAPTFERYHPQEIWARRMLVQIVMTASAPEESIIQQAFQHFTTPGTANYLKALHDLYQATQKKHNSEARVGFLASSVVNSMTAALVEQYFGARPDDWELFRTAPNEHQRLALAFWTDAQIVAQDSALWLGVADALERHHAARK